MVVLIMQISKDILKFLRLNKCLRNDYMCSKGGHFEVVIHYKIFEIILYISFPDLNNDISNYIFSFLKNYGPILPLVNKNWNSKFPKYKQEKLLFLLEIISRNDLNTFRNSRNYGFIIFAKFLLEKEN